jgi:hypothetical protein
MLMTCASNADKKDGHDGDDWLQSESGGRVWDLVLLPPSQTIASALSPQVHGNCAQPFGHESFLAVCQNACRHNQGHRESSRGRGTVSTTRTENDFLSSRATTPIADVSGNQHQDRYRGLLVYDLRRSMAQNMRNFGIGRGGSYRVVPKLN